MATKNKAWIAGAAAAALLVAAAGWAWLGRGADAQARGGKPATAPVPLEFAAHEVVQPQREPLPRRIEMSGPLVAPATAVLRTRAAGTLVALEVAEGARVRAGQLLGRVDAADAASRVAEREAQLAALRAQREQAERQHATNRRLAEQQFIAPTALEASQAALDAAQAQERAAAAALDGARVAARETRLVAPIGGLVHKRHALPGEKLGIDQPVLTIVDLGALELAATVATHEVSALAVGQPVAVRVEGHEADAPGRIARIAPAAEPGTRAIGVAVALANPGERFRAGQYALGRVVVDDPAPRLTLPDTAVAGPPGQRQVWVIAGGALRRTAVTTGRHDAATGRIELVGGLEPGAQVLALPFDGLRDGAPAKVVVGSAPVASAAASRPLLR